MWLHTFFSYSGSVFNAHNELGQMPFSTQVNRYQSRTGKVRKQKRLYIVQTSWKKCQIRTAKLFRIKLYHLKTILKTRSQWNDHQDTVSWLKPFDDGPRLYEKPRASLRLSCPWLPGFNAPPRRGSRGLARAISWPVPTERSNSSVRPSTSWSSTQHTFMTCTHWEIRLQCQAFHLLIIYTTHLHDLYPLRDQTPVLDLPPPDHLHNIPSWPVPTESSDSSVRPSTSWSSTQHTFMTCTHWEIKLQC